METKQLCPRRPAGNMFNLPETDKWEIRHDGFYHCSFCGSLHPDEVLKLIKEHGFGIIEHSDKQYKWYLDIPKNDHLKYYRHHDTTEFIDGYNNLINEFRNLNKSVETDGWKDRFNPASFNPNAS